MSSEIQASSNHSKVSDDLSIAPSTTTSGVEGVPACEGELPFKISTHNRIWAMCSAWNSCNLGYDIGVGTKAGPLVQEHFDLTTGQLQLFMGSMSFWAIFGAFFSHCISDRFGRRSTLALALIFFLIGETLMAAAPSYTVLMIGRFFVGYGVGTGFAIDPLYISEITPAKNRGKLVTWSSELFTNVGLVIGFAAGLIFMPIPDDVSWRYMFGLGVAFTLLMLCLVAFVMPESPRWLVANNREADAMVVLRKVYPPEYDIDNVVRDIREAIEREEEADKATGWRKILCPKPAIRRMLLVGIGVAIGQHAVGIDAIQYYLLYVLDAIGVESELEQNLILIGLGIVKMMFVLFAGKLIDSWGRRPMFFISLVGMIVALVMIAIAFFKEDSSASPFLVVAGVTIYFAAFSTGMGPGAWLIPSEVFAPTIRAKGLSLATCFNRIADTLVGSTFLSTADAMGWAPFFLLLAADCAIVLIFIYIFLPETSGKTLEEMMVYFATITGDTSVLEAEQTILDRRALVAESKRQNDDEI